MKRVISIICILCMVLALTACGSPSSTTPATDSGKATAAPSNQGSGSSSQGNAAPAEETVGGGGDLVIGTSTYAGDFSAWGISSQTSHVQSSPVYESLTLLDEDGNWYPYLLESLTPDPEKLTWTLVARDGVCFSDGTPLDADAIMWNFENYAENSRMASLHFRYLDHFEKVDDKTVVMHLTEWSSQVPFSFLDSVGLMYSPKAFADNGMDWCLVNPVGTGAYVQTDCVAGEYRKFEINQNYWNKDATPKYDTITFKVIANESTAQAALLSGEIDGYILPSFAMIDSMVSTNDFYFAQNHTTYTSEFFYPPSANEPWNDINVRKAVYYAIDSQAIVDAVTYGYASVATQYAPPGSKFEDPSITGYGYDLNKAKEYLAKSNYPDGFTSKLYVQTSNEEVYRQLSVIIQSQLKQIGINLEIEMVEAGVWIQAAFSPDGVPIWAHSYGYNLALQQMQNFGTHGSGMGGPVKTLPEEIVEASKKAIAAPTEEEMIQHVKEANKIMTEDATAYLIYTSFAYGGIWNNKVADSGCLDNYNLVFDFTKVAPKK